LYPGEAKHWFMPRILLLIACQLFALLLEVWLEVWLELGQCKSVYPLVVMGFL